MCYWVELGINLQCAENVYIMVSTEIMNILGVFCLEQTHVPLQETSWNPAMEAQVIYELYRLGQVNLVNVYRYYVHGKLEKK